jgi:succinoglycan biosynthesis transport protein ExoP
VSLSQLFRILWARKRTLLGFIAAAIVLALIANLLLPKKYTGEAAVVVDLNGGDPLKDGALSPAAQTAYVATQIDVIGSHNVALKVVDSQKLADNPETQANFQDATDGVGSLRDWLADYLLTKLVVKTAPNSNVVLIDFTNKNQQLAADFANAFADAYIQTTLDLKVDPAQRQSGWFNQQIQALRGNLETAQQKLATYQSEHDVIGVDDSKIDVENGRLQELSNQLVAAQSAMYQTNAREQQMNEVKGTHLPDELTDVAKNPLLQNLKAELARAEAKFADVSQRYERNHPQYQSAAAERDALQRKIAGEINNTKGYIAKEAALARQQSGSLQQAVDEQRAHILSLKHAQDEMTVLRHDVDSARTTYDAALQRASEVQLESRLDHSNIAILGRAPVPTSPTSPRPWLNLALAVILGGLLAVGVILSREMTDRHIHSRLDLLEAVNLPLLFELPLDELGPKPNRLTNAAKLTRRLSGPGSPPPPSPAAA